MRRSSIGSAASSRARALQAAGEAPAASRNRRSNVRPLIAALAAHSSFVTARSGRLRNARHSSRKGSSEGTVTWKGSGAPARSSCRISPITAPSRPETS
ncbi:hypothetical protein BMH25_09720 [Leucobacter sp. OLCALW19]|nr:hypothetical protein BMH25_09720 [Leucobacter sp. OLCALW19]